MFNAYKKYKQLLETTRWALKGPCKHQFVADNQIKVVRCQLCNEVHWIEYGNAYSLHPQTQKR